MQRDVPAAEIEIDVGKALMFNAMGDVLQGSSGLFEICFVSISMSCLLLGR